MEIFQYGIKEKMIELWALNKVRLKLTKYLDMLIFKICPPIYSIFKIIDEMKNLN